MPLFSTFSTVCEIWSNGRAALSSLTWPRLTPARPVSSAPVRPRMVGSPAMISISGAAASSWPVVLADLLGRQEQQAVPLEELAGTERLHRFEILGVAVELLGQRIGGGAGEFRRRRLDHRQDQLFAIECLLELVVALAPVQVGRNQRVDVGVDGEIAGGIEARRRPPARSERTRTRGQTAYKPLTIETTILVSTSFLSELRRACRKRPLSSGVPSADLMLFWLLVREVTDKPAKRAETASELDIARGSGEKVTNK